MSASPSHEPLRILFCGSDDFSCASLQALHDEMARQAKEPQPAATSDPAPPGRIASLDVVVRPAKRTGRGLKTVVESPVKQLAAALGLRVHERDTFTGWTPPPTNMVVAVSFGLFVPPRLLRAARYGGLNVHPSLLPDLHGAAPIEHALLRGRARTGVTVQTLHERTFDGGRILLQGPPGEPQLDDPSSSPPGLEISPRCTATALRHQLAPLGAALLVEVLRRGLYLPDATTVPVPLSSLFPYSSPAPAAAPKLRKADREVPWRPTSAAAAPPPPLSSSSSSARPPLVTTTAADVDRRARALGPLWTHITRPNNGRGEREGEGSAEASPPPPPPPPPPKRIILDDINLVPCPAALWDELAGGGPTHSTSAFLHGSQPSVLPTVTFQQHQQQQDPTSPFTSRVTGQPHQNQVTLPYVVDGDAVVLPVGVDAALDGGDHSQLSDACLRIGTVKVEGDRAKPAARALEAWTGKDTPLGQISWDVVLRTC